MDSLQKIIEYCRTLAADPYSYELERNALPEVFEGIASRLEALQGDPVAWIVQAEYPFVTQDPPIDGGLPRIPLYAAPPQADGASETGDKTGRE